MTTTLTSAPARHALPAVSQPQPRAPRPGGPRGPPGPLGVSVPLAPRASRARVSAGSNGRPAQHDVWLAASGRLGVDQGSV
jgi:hypothetical protein